MHATRMTRNRDLLERIKIARDYASYDELLQWSDLLDANSLPSLATQAAVESTENIVKTAKEIKMREREEVITNFVSDLPFFIPIVGEAAGVAGLAAIRPILILAGVAGDPGLLVYYGIVADPSSSFANVFSFLPGAPASAETGLRALPMPDVLSSPAILTSWDRSKRISTWSRLCVAPCVSEFHRPNSVLCPRVSKIKIYIAKWYSINVIALRLFYLIRRYFLLVMLYKILQRLPGFLLAF
ncbi:hypothetical protein FQN49_000026 [Arthroderma sp. PD_2]|nr:hypothetical protein FQN49_000026 [Arthroderma sp. PD_2]